MTGSEQSCDVWWRSSGGMRKEVRKLKRLDIAFGFDAGLASCEIAEQVCVRTALDDDVGPSIGDMKLTGARPEEGSEVARRERNIRGHFAGAAALGSSAVGCIAAGCVRGNVRQESLDCRSIAGHRGGRGVRRRHRGT